mgnify:CR=1 FL=1
MSEREPCQQFVRQWPVGNGEWIDTTGKVCPRCGFVESEHPHAGEDYDEVATVNAEIHEEIERLKERLQDLPGDWREALLMRAEGELSFKEIAEIQGITEETARWRVFKARQRVNQGSQDTPAKLEKKG